MVSRFLPHLASSSSSSSSAYFASSSNTAHASGLAKLALDGNLTLSIGTLPLDRCCEWRRLQGGGDDDECRLMIIGHELRLQRDGAPPPLGSRSLILTAAARKRAREGGGGAFRCVVYEAVRREEFARRALRFSLRHRDDAAVAMFAHEVLVGPCKMFLDIEVNRVLNPQRDCEAMHRAIVRETCRVLAWRRSYFVQRAMGARAHDDDAGDHARVLVLDASNERKFSRHVVVQDTRADDSLVWAGVAALVLRRLGPACAVRVEPRTRHVRTDVTQPALDMTVYRRRHMMRALASSKAEDTERAFVPVFLGAVRAMPHTLLGAACSADDDVAPASLISAFLPDARDRVANHGNMLLPIEVAALRAQNVGGLLVDDDRVHGDATAAPAAQPLPAPMSRASEQVQRIVRALALPGAASKITVDEALHVVKINSHSRVCAIGRVTHTGNHVFFVAHLRTCKYAQRCFNTRCAAAPTVWLNFPAAAAALARHYLREQHAEPLSTGVARALFGADI